MLARYEAVRMPCFPSLSEGPRPPTYPGDVVRHETLAQSLYIQRPIVRLNVEWFDVAQFSRHPRRQFVVSLTDPAALNVLTLRK